MICDKHCPLLSKETGGCRKNGTCELKDKGSICSDCIHDEVCCLEGHLDPAMTFCADKLQTDVAGALSRTSGLRLSDILPVLPSSWFTVLAPNGEISNACTYSYPEKFKVLKINYDVEQQSLAVVVEEA